MPGKAFKKGGGMLVRPRKPVLKDSVMTNSGIGEPSVYHALVVIFLEFFAWGLLTMPIISTLNNTFPDHTFLMNGLIMGIKGFLSFLSAPLIGALSDNWGRKFFLLITVFFTCAPIPLMTINTWWFFAMISISGGQKFRSVVINNIKNKTVRRQQVRKMLLEKAKKKKEEKKKRRKDLKAGIKVEVEKKVPHTIESLRVQDETVLDPNKEGNEEKIEETNVDITTDEYENYFNPIGDYVPYEPKVLITYSHNPTKISRSFGIELCRMIPNSLTRYRNRSNVKTIVQSAKERKFTDIIVINEDQRKPNGLLVTHLPDGPTAYFRMSNVKLTKDINRSHKEITGHRPEVILNNFTTRLGTSVGRMLAALFHYDPQFQGRRVATFHNQRDYIFFRHHRYEFTKDGKRAKLHETGPRFTLRLEYLQQGTFDSKFGEYIWIKANRRHELESNRRKFHL